MRLVEGRAAVDDVDAFVAELAAIGEAHGAVVQAFDARYVAGRAHLEAAARSARRAREHDDAIADDPAVELLLYAAGRRQIDRALTMGVDAGEGPVVVVVDGGEPNEVRRASPDERSGSGVREPNEVRRTSLDERSESGGGESSGTGRTPSGEHGEADGGTQDAAAGEVAALLEPAETLGAARDEAAIREFFDIPDAELAATDASLEALVVERVVLLAVEK